MSKKHRQGANGNISSLSRRGIILLFALATLLAALPAHAEKNPLRKVYFGETHVHTGRSFDAYIFGNRHT